MWFHRRLNRLIIPDLLVFWILMPDLFRHVLQLHCARLISISSTFIEVQDKNKDGEVCMCGVFICHI